MNFIKVLLISSLIFSFYDLAVAGDSVPFDTYGSAISGEPVDPNWVEYCMSEGFNTGFQGYRIGTATHLGVYTATERGCLDFSLYPIVQSRNIESTLIAANGDELYYIAEADFDFLNPPEIIWGVFEFVGGTGRFENASGGGEVQDIGVGASGAVLRLVGAITYDASDRRKRPE